MTIGFKIISISITILIVATGVSTVLNTINFTHEYSKILKTNTFVLGQYLKLQLDKILRLGIPLNALIGFEKALKDVVDNYIDIDYALVSDTSGLILFANDMKYAETPILDMKILNAIKEAREIVHITMFNNKKYYFAVIPVLTQEKKHVCSILVGLPLSVVTNKTSNIFFYSFILAGVFIILAVILFTLGINFWVTGPLVNLVNVIEDIRANKILDKEVPVTSRDEIGHLANVFNRMTKELEEYKNTLIEKEVINKELQIAVMIQTALLPKINTIQNQYYEIYAEMLPASHVGGDYYDIIINPDGKIWCGIGDVSGHGILAGLIMMMLQTSALSYIKESPDIQPDQLIAKTNRILYENIRNRLNTTHFMTLSFLCCREDGHVEVAGKHLPVIVYCFEKQKCEIHTIKGIWSGLMQDFNEKHESCTLKLKENDQIFLYTDGIIEARNKSRKQYNYDQFIASINKWCKEKLSVKEIVNGILDDIRNFMEKQDDDITILSIRKL